MKKKKGFTLAELLVVVLIIGILAAVALPKYQKAIEKARFTTYRTLADSMVKAVEAFRLANSAWPTSLDELVMDFPADFNIQNTVSPNGICRRNNKMFCCMSYPSSAHTIGGAIKCGDTGYHLMYIRGYANTSGVASEARSCHAKEAKYKALCQALCGGKTLTSTYSLTPSGWLSGYSGCGLD